MGQVQELRETLGAQMNHLKARLSVSRQSVRGQCQGGAGAGDEGSDDKAWGSPSGNLRRGSGVI